MANLPIPDEQTWIQYDSFVGTGPLNFSFSIFSKADLTVYIDGIVLEQSDFVLTGTLIDSGYDGGSIALVDAVAGADVLIARKVTPVRTTDFAPANNVPIVAIDAALDRLTANAQDARRDISRAIVVPFGDDSDLRLPSAADRSNRLLGFDGTGGVTTYVQGSGGGGGGDGDFLPLSGGTLTGPLVLPSNGLRFGADTALYRGSGVLSATNYAANAWRRVAGGDPVNANDFVTKGWAEDNLSGGGGGGGTSPGFIDVVADTDGGTIDLSGLAGTNGGVAFVTSDGVDDTNVWQIIGLDKGDSCQIIFAEAFGLLFKAGFWGTQKLFGNWEGAEREDGTGPNTAILPVDNKDVLNVICTSVVSGVSICRVWLTENQYIGRPLLDIAGSSQDPNGAFLSLGTIGKWSPTKGIPFGDFLMYTSGTVRKPIFGGLNLRGVGDTCPIFIEVYRAEDQDEGAGLETPRFAVPWDDPFRIGSHISFRQRRADGGGKLIFCDDTPTGWITGPGSLLQGISAQIDFFTQSLPTASSTPGGFTLRSTRPGINTPIDNLSLLASGGVLFHGKAAIEGSGHIFGYLTQFLTEGNGQLWHSPSLDTDRTMAGTATINLISTDVSSSIADNFADISMRRYGSHGNGLDIGYRADEAKHWLFPVGAGSRRRGVGFEPDLSGVFIGGENALDWHHAQTARIQLSNDQNIYFALRAGQFGWVRIATDDGHLADFSVSAAGSVTRLMTSTSGLTWSNNNGTSSSTNVDVDVGRLRIRNRTGAARNYYVTLHH